MAEQPTPAAEEDETQEAQIAQPTAVRVGPNGRPMASITVSISDKIPTVPYGSMMIHASSTRYIEDRGSDDAGRQHRLDELRLLARDVEFAVGVERRLAQWAIDPSSRVESPIDGKDAFAVPSPGYDPTKVADPRPPVQAPAAEVPAPVPTPSAQAG